VANLKLHMHLEKSVLSRLCPAAGDTLSCYSRKLMFVYSEIFRARDICEAALRLGFVQQDEALEA